MPQPHTVRFQCRHIFTDGRRCQSPTLRRPAGHDDFCYYHHTTRRPVEHPKARRSRRSTFTLPLPEDRSAIQLAIGQVLQKIAANDLDPRRAGLLLYGLQIASLNLPKPNPKEDARPEDTVAEITHDPILGPLAPPAELGSLRPKTTLQRLLEDLRSRQQTETPNPDNHEAEHPQPTTLPALHATAAEPAAARNDIRMTSVRRTRSLNSLQPCFPGSFTRVRLRNAPPARSRVHPALPPRLTTELVSATGIAGS